jgi:hypothetical protein
MLPTVRLQGSPARQETPAPVSAGTKHPHTRRPSLFLPTYASKETARRVTLNSSGVYIWPSAVKVRVTGSMPSGGQKMA